MITLKLEEKKYDLPTSFEELILGKYQEIVEINKELPFLEKYVKILNILTGIDEEKIKEIDIKQLNVISNAISYIFKEEQKGLIDRFKLDGTKYGFNNHLTSIKFGEFIDLEEFSKSDEVNKNLHILMAILYRPIKRFKKRTIFSYLKKEKDDKYEIEDYNSDEVMERAKLFKEKLSMDKVLGTMVFFSLLRLTIIQRTAGYSERKMKKELLKMMKELKIHQAELNG